MAKRLDSAYEARARNFNWIKLKQTYRGGLSDTLDVVIVGYFRGRGARARVGIGAVLVSVFDPRTDTFPTIAKVGSGLSEQGWVDLRRILDQIRAGAKPARIRSRLTADVWAWSRSTSLRHLRIRSRVRRFIFVGLIVKDAVWRCDS